MNNDGRIQVTYFQASVEQLLLRWMWMLMDRLALHKIYGSYKND